MWKLARYITNSPRYLTAFIFDESRFLKNLKMSVITTYITAFVMIFLLVFLAFRPAPPVPNTTEDFNRISRVQFFAQNYLTLWLTGTASDGAAVKQMLGDEKAAPSEWNTEPVEVSDLNVARLESNSAGPDTQWVVTIGATLVRPGTGAPQRNYFAVTVMDHDGSLAALTLPRVVNNSRPQITVDSAYNGQISTSSTLGTTVTNFVSAFYTSQSGALGRFVSSNFTAEPIVNSPYTATNVVRIDSRSEVDVQNAAEGTAVDLLVTVKASTSVTTFTTLQVPLKVHAIDNGQWVVDAISDLTYFSTVRQGR
ncbi:MAG: hypothetical protein ACJA07_000490 [Rhodococcus sp. (in: high G+C Gram-positive bacteria)]|jgi:hypothetical protein